MNRRRCTTRNRKKLGQLGLLLIGPMDTLVRLVQVERPAFIALFNQLHCTGRVEICRVEDLVHDMIAWKFILPHIFLARACVDRTMLWPLPPSVPPMVVFRRLQITDVRVEASVDWQVMRCLVPKLQLATVQ